LLYHNNHPIATRRNFTNAHSWASHTDCAHSHCFSLSHVGHSRLSLPVRLHSLQGGSRCHSLLPKYIEYATALKRYSCTCFPGFPLTIMAARSCRVSSTLGKIEHFCCFLVIGKLLARLHKVICSFKRAVLPHHTSRAHLHTNRHTHSRAQTQTNM